MQPQGHVQILLNIIDFGMNIQEAGDAARWIHSGSAQPTGECAIENGGEVGIEMGISEAIVDDLKARGHLMNSEELAGQYGGYQCIQRGKSGVYFAASEMRKDGQAVAY